ncbi:MAG: radical SAM protein [Firmicutes bacterium]|nr:radical SAM protein [Bacillota bacterium]
MKEIKAKTILQKVRANPFMWFAQDYNMNLYKGCVHGCIYCDSRSDCYKIEEFDEIKIKENALFILENELAKKKRKGIVGMGAMSDPYNPLEQSLELTRKALSLFKKYEFGVSIATKSNLIERDIDLLTEINKNQSVIVQITITTASDELSKIIEPHVCFSSKRFETLEKLAYANIFAGILMMPILPFINDTEENVRQLVLLAHLHQAKFIYPMFGVTLRQNQREYFYERLDELFPEKKKMYQTQFHDQYVCLSPSANHLKKVFKEECKKYNILYKMKDINEAFIKKPKIEQLTLDI